MSTIDFHQWTEESYDPDATNATRYGVKDPNWQVAADGSSISQQFQSQGTFYYSDFNSLGQTLCVNLKVKPGSKSNIIGFAINFHPNDTNNANADFLVLTWLARDDKAPGLRLYNVHGVPDYIEFLDLDDLVATANTLGSAKWQHEQLYEFKFSYTEDKLQIWVDGNLEFDLNGQFQDGRYALFDIAQGGVVFSNAIAEPVTPPVNWEQVTQSQFQPQDIQSKDQFGYSVDISGQRAIASAIWNDAPNTPDVGAAYIIELQGDAWSQTQKLQPDDLQRGDTFGQSVAISGERIVVGASKQDAPNKPDAGAVYIFELQGGTWVQTQKLQPDDLKRNDNFGHSVVIGEETIIVGAVNKDFPNEIEAGAAYIFELQGGTWVQTQKLQPDDLKREDNFGQSMAISGDTILIGANRVDFPNKPNAGTVYVFELQGNAWVEKEKLQTGDLKYGDALGSSVAISGTKGVVGALYTDTAEEFNTGGAYIYELEAGQWLEKQKLQPAELQRSYYFGVSLGISGNTAVVGSNGAYNPHSLSAGATYIYQLEGGQWLEKQKLQPADIQEDDRFGISVAISEDKIIVGADHTDDGDKLNVGTVYLFQGSVS